MTSYQRLKKKFTDLSDKVFVLQKDLNLLMLGNEEGTGLVDGKRQPLSGHGYGQSDMAKEQIIKRVGQLT